jgi:hypothetical protein
MISNHDRAGGGGATSYQLWMTAFLFFVDGDFVLSIQRNVYGVCMLCRKIILSHYSAEGLQHLRSLQKGNSFLLYRERFTAFTDSAEREFVPSIPRKVYSIYGLCRKGIRFFYAAKGLQHLRTLQKGNSFLLYRERFAAFTDSAEREFVSSMPRKVCSICELCRKGIRFFYAAKGLQHLRTLQKGNSFLLYREMFTAVVYSLQKGKSFLLYCERFTTFVISAEREFVPSIPRSNSLISDLLGIEQYKDNMSFGIKLKITPQWPNSDEEFYLWCTGRAGLICVSRARRVRCALQQQDLGTFTKICPERSCICIRYTITIIRGGQGLHYEVTKLH